MASLALIRATSLGLTLLAAGTASAQVFHPEDVERAKTFYVGNAGGSNDCLQTLNLGMRALFDEQRLQLGSTVDLSMMALKRAGKARGPIVMGFFDERGRRTSGVTEPKTLRESVWNRMLSEANGVAGWHLFGLSPMDGYHSIMLALDLQDPTDPKVFWADQWGTKGGWKLYPDKEALDGEIQSLTNGWWKRFLNEKGFQAKSDSKLYPLVPTRTPSNNKATIARVTRLNLRSGPGSEHEVLAQGRTGDEFQIIGRQDLWVQLRLPDGREAWAHRYYLTQVYDPSVGSAGLVNSLASSGGE